MAGTPPSWRHYHGAVVDPGAAPGALAILPARHVLVAPDGFVEYVGADPPPPDFIQLVGAATLVELPPGAVIMPGFVDTHVHAAQIQYAGTGTDLPLMQWLTKYAFPSERRLTNDLEASERVYDALVRKLLRSGTTTALFFAVIGAASSQVLADVACRHGQRAFVGKVAMDRLAPEDYVETTEEAAASTEAFILHVRDACRAYSSYARALAGCGGGGHDVSDKHWIARAADRDLPLVEPVVTPRFVPCCTETLLRNLGALAQKHGVLVQSHAVESVDCLDCVAEMHPGSDEVEILQSAGLLGPNSVMAHCVHITDGQAAAFRRTGTGIACCPLSNFYFAGGALRTAALLEAGNKIGLGTDVAGGYSHRMLDSVRHAVTTHLCVASADANAARMEARKMAESGGGSEGSGGSSSASGSCALAPPRCEGVAPGAGRPMGRDEFNYKHAIWTATVGGARLLGLEGKVGRVLPGYAFDACVVDLSQWLEGESASSVETAFEKFVHLGGEAEIMEVYVQGRPSMPT
jgi:guanine deaminase